MPRVARDLEFCRQIRGSARGAPRTISEGFGRFRPADFARYLEYAHGSLNETQNHLDDALDCEYLTREEHHALYALADRAIGATTKLHAYLESCKRPPRRRQRKLETFALRGDDLASKPRTRTPNPNPEPRTPNPEPRTPNPEPRTPNRTNPAP